MQKIPREYNNGRPLLITQDTVNDFHQISANILMTLQQYFGFRLVKITDFVTFCPTDSPTSATVENIGASRHEIFLRDLGFHDELFSSK